MENNVSRLALAESKIEACKRFLDGIEAGEHPKFAFLKSEVEYDLRYWQDEFAKANM